LDSRERIEAILHLEEPDRVGFWIELFNETWLKYIEKDNSLPKKNYKLSMQKLGTETFTIGGDHGLSPHGYDSITIDETDDYAIIRDRSGEKKKIQGDVTEILEKSINRLEDYKEKIEAFMDHNDPRRVTSSRYPYKMDLEKAIKNRQKNCFVNLWLSGPFEMSRGVFGYPGVLIVMVKDPHFAGYVFDSIAKYQARIGKAYIDAGVDGIMLGEDMSYKKGPLFSPEHYRKLLAPAHKKVFHPFRKNDKACIIHTDGNVKKLIPDLIKSGITALNPLEVKAGLDVNELKLKYGDKIAFVGGIDVRTLGSTKEAIKKEVTEKIEIAGQDGGYVIGPDHCIPPSVSYENYQYFYKLAKKYGKYPTRKSNKVNLS
jgi:uroporphyrinogen decarboxylase